MRQEKIQDLGICKRGVSGPARDEKVRPVQAKWAENFGKINDFNSKIA